MPVVLLRPSYAFPCQVCCDPMTRTQHRGIDKLTAFRAGALHSFTSFSTLAAYTGEMAANESIFTGMMIFVSGSHFHLSNYCAANRNEPTPGQKIVLALGALSFAAGQFMGRLVPASKVSMGQECLSNSSYKRQYFCPPADVQCCKLEQ